MIIGDITKMSPELKKLPAVERIKIVCDLYESGLNVPETAQAAGVTENTVKQYLHLADVTIDEKVWKAGGETAQEWARAWNKERRKWIK